MNLKKAKLSETVQIPKKLLQCGLLTVIEVQKTTCALSSKLCLLYYYITYIYITEDRSLSSA